MGVAHPDFDKLFLAPELLRPGVKPLGNFKVDWDHHLSKGLVAYWIFNKYGDAIELVNNALPSSTAAGDWETNNQGPALYGNGTSDYISVGDMDVLDFGSRNYSLAGRIRPDTISNTKRMMVLGKDDKALGRQLTLEINGKGASASRGALRTTWFQSNSTYRSIDTPAGTLTQGTVHDIIIGRSSSNSGYAYVDGVSQSISAGGTASGAMQSTPASAQIMRRSYSTARDFYHGGVYWLGVWDGRIFSQHEALELQQNPYQLLKPAGTIALPVASVGGSSALTGTVTASITESDIVTGGKTIILTLTGDTWVAAGATFDAQRQNIINGLDSAQAEATGWDAEVKAKEVVGSVVRTSDTVVTITLSAAASYDITAQETITATVPASALVTSSTAIVSTPTFTVDPVAAGFQAHWGMASRKSKILGAR